MEALCEFRYSTPSLIVYRGRASFVRRYSTAIAAKEGAAEANWHISDLFTERGQTLHELVYGTRQEVFSHPNS